MNKYETVLIINPNLSDDEIKSTITKVSDLINANGKVTSVEEMGKKKLAYEIQKCKEGFYVVIYFQADAEAIAELERNYRIMESIIKFIVVRKD